MSTLHRITPVRPALKTWEVLTAALKLVEAGETSLYEAIKASCNTREERIAAEETVMDVAKYHGPGDIHDWPDGRPKSDLVWVLSNAIYEADQNPTGQFGGDGKA